MNLPHPIAKEHWDLLAVYMNFTEQGPGRFVNFTFNNGKWWFATLAFNDQKANRYRIENYGPDGYFTFCQPQFYHDFWNIYCGNYTGKGSSANRNNFGWWYNDQRPEIDIVISFSAVITLTGVIGKFK